ncbi:hydantoinase/oxoprolinase family protein [Acidimangrovimonas sediminis]|uniref:hydantoinase/oxoprolinase family protein n=1 Tax=Acidimangrovimonas sediminis TaxID=2056283 RepID=UPI000C7F8E78|nr:hydantoinase/oxoprolinase family protein [Acidimangrovimonas sediminis]
MPSYRIGCDVGGTFTDLCVVEAASGDSVFVKIPTTVGHQATAVLEATRLALDEAALDSGQVGSFAHGTTVATNALIERKGAKTAFIVTEGFRDLMQIARQTRPDLYDAHARRAAPLAPRDLSFELPERIDAEGRVVRPLDEDALEEIARALKAEAVQSVAVVLLHSYANPVHERQAGEILARLLPGVDISLSVDVLPQPGEFERASTTLINAYVMPPLRSYLERLSEGLAEAGFAEPPAIMQSNGGLMSAAVAGAAKSVHTCLSGPAAGLSGARAFAAAAQYANVVTVDMGGTSFDIGLIRDGKVVTRHEGEIEGLPVRVPMFDIITLGAGGGSIAGVDAEGVLRVGPESAGATPGPASYGKGGTRPTVTDANVVLGKLRDGRPLGGGLKISREAAETAIRTHVADPLGLDTDRAAEGVIEVVNAAMMRGIRRVTVERGFDPRDFALFAFGGAGPFHAIDLAQALGMKTVIIPPSPGLLCAIGLLLSPWRHDESVTVERPIGDLSRAETDALLAPLTAGIARQAAEELITATEVTTLCTADLRYAGQGRSLRVTFDAAAPDAAVEAFHALHQQTYGYARRDQTVELAALHVTGEGPAPSAVLPRPKTVAGNPVVGEASVRLDGQRLTVPVVDRVRLAPGSRITGPALLEQQDSTLLLGYQEARIDSVGNLIIELET